MTDTKLITFHEARLKKVTQKANRVLKKCKSDTAYIRAYSTEEMKLYVEIGWEIQALLSLGRGAGFQSYLMKKKTNV